MYCMKKKCIKRLHQIHINSHATHTHTLVKCTKTKHEKSNAVVSVKIGHKFTEKNIQIGTPHKKKSS